MDPYLVFGQRDDARLDAAALEQQAKRFFETKLHVEGMRLTIGAETRAVTGRLTQPDDWDAAERADSRAGYTGLATLARRCRSVFVVEALSANDRTALLLAAILASVLLGPILRNDELFGVRTARLKLERPG